MCLRQWLIPVQPSLHLPLYHSEASACLLLTTKFHQLQAEPIDSHSLRQSSNVVSTNQISYLSEFTLVLQLGHHPYMCDSLRRCQYFRNSPYRPSQYMFLGWCFCRFASSSLYPLWNFSGHRPHRTHHSCEATEEIEDAASCTFPLSCLSDTMTLSKDVHHA